MAFIILVANMWGIVLKEWGKVSQKTKSTFVVGLLAILLSVLLVGYGNYLKDKKQNEQTVSFVRSIK